MRSSIGLRTSPSNTWPVEPRSLLPRHVAAAEFQRIHADRGADLVGVALEREGVVDAVAGAKRAVGRGIGIDRAARKPHRAKAVIAAERVGGHRRQEYLLAAIGAAIHQHDRFAADDLAIFGDRRADAEYRRFPGKGRSASPPAAS